MKKIKIASALAALLFVVASSFTTSFDTFYAFDDSFGFGEQELRNIELYHQAANGCDEGTNICGVLLSTAQGPDENPDPIEFAAIVQDIVDSQGETEPTDPDVVLKD